MFINLSLLEKHNLYPSDLTLLTAIKLNSAGKNEEYLNKWLSEDDYKRYEALEYTKLVKPVKKTDGLYKRLRISDKMSKVLNDLSCGGEGISEDTEKLANWIFDIYGKKPNGIIRNRKETKRRIQWFSEITSIQQNALATLIASFIQDSYEPEQYATFKEFKEQNPRAIFSNCCDNICWSPPNDRAVHYTLDDSPLYAYYIQNEEFIKGCWKQNGL